MDGDEIFGALENRSMIQFKGSQLIYLQMIEIGYYIGFKLYHVMQVIMIIF